jgi:hypothetical protein
MRRCVQEGSQLSALGSQLAGSEDPPYNTKTLPYAGTWEPYTLQGADS